MALRKGTTEIVGEDDRLYEIEATFIKGCDLLAIVDDEAHGVCLAHTRTGRYITQCPSIEDAIRCANHLVQSDSVDLLFEDNWEDIEAALVEAVRSAPLLQI